MNASHYFSQLIDSIENGPLTDLVDVKTSTTTSATKLTNIESCYDVDNGRIQCDQQTINGYAIDTGAGNVSTGTQRVIIASDDPRLGDIATSTGRVAQCVDLVNSHVEVDTNAINGVTMAVNSGNNSDGTQRMTIANDDTLKGPIHTMGTLTDIYSAGTTKGFVVAGAQLDGKLAPMTLTNSGYVANDFSKVMGNNVSVGTGTADSGCIRVCGASNDTAWAKLSALTNSQYTYASQDKSFTVGTRDTSYIQQCPLGIGLARHDGVSMAVTGWNAFMTSGSGNIADVPSYSGGDAKDAYACPRVCIATDDVNLAAIKSDLDTIKNILTDIWNSTNHYIRTHETA